MSAQFGSMAKRMQHGFASHNGLIAALLAREDYTGIEQVYETPYVGFLSCFGQGSGFKPATIPGELGKSLVDWKLTDICVKLHASMAVLHCRIDCIEKLQQEHPELFSAANLRNIVSIKTEHSKPAFEHGGWIAPRDKPLSSLGAQMSTQYATVAQLIDCKAMMEQFGAAKLNRLELRELMDKVAPVYDPELDADTWRTIVTVSFADGTEVRADLPAAKGLDPPASNDDVVRKWRSLVHGVLDDAARDQIEKLVLGLQDIADVRDLIKLLQVQVKCPIDV